MVKPYILTIKEIAELSRKYHYWKVHLLGDLSINSRTQEMLIDAWVVPLKEPDLYKNKSNHHRLINNYYFDFSKSESRRVKVGVGQLPVLLHGTILRDGSPVAHPKYLTRKFEFSPTEQNQKIISVGDSWGRWNDKNRYYIPSVQFQTFQKKSDDNGSFFAPQVPYASKFLVVEFSENEPIQASLDEYPLNQQRWFAERGIKAEVKDKPLEGATTVHGIIFPCLELIRFYMTYSSQSWQEILSDGIAGVPNRFFVPEKTIKPLPDGSGGMLMLSKYITDDDHQVISRPAFDDYALSEFRRPYISSLNNHLKTGAFLPEARFPFINQKTKLTVHGTYLQTGNRVYFLVYWISYCTAKFPYQNAAYFRENPGTKTAPQTKADVFQNTLVVDEESDKILGEKFDYNAEATKNVTRRFTEGGEAQSDEAPSKDRGKMLLSLNQEDRFEYQKTHPLTEEQPKTAAETRGASKPVNPLFSTIAETQETVGTAPPSGGSPVTPVSIIPNTRKTTSSPLVGEWKVREIATTVEKKDKAEIEDELYDSAGNSNVDQITESKSEDKELKTEEIEKQKINQPNAGKRHNLPINLQVFKQIVAELCRLDKSLSGRLITLPATGEYSPTTTATIFPSLLFNPGRINEADAEPNRGKLTRRTRELPDELFIAEIKNEDDHFAYLIDMEAITTQTGNIARSFQMLLYFNRHIKLKLTGDQLRTIIGKCEKNKGKWIDFDETDSENIQEEQKENKATLKNERAGYAFKHNMDSAEKYATRILYALIAARWFEGRDQEY